MFGCFSLIKNNYPDPDYQMVLMIVLINVWFIVHCLSMLTLTLPAQLHKVMGQDFRPPSLMTSCTPSPLLSCITSIYLVQFV